MTSVLALAISEQQHALQKTITSSNKSNKLQSHNMRPVMILAELQVAISASPIIPSPPTPLLDLRSQSSQPEALPRYLFDLGVRRVRRTAPPWSSDS